MINVQYRWVIVAAGGLLGCVAMGAMFALPIFLRPIAEDSLPRRCSACICGRTLWWS